MVASLLPSLSGTLAYSVVASGRWPREHSNDQRVPSCLLICSVELPESRLYLTGAIDCQEYLKSNTRSRLVIAIRSNSDIDSNQIHLPQEFVVTVLHP